LLVAACGDDVTAVLPEVTDATEYVDSRIGTGGLGFAHGSCFVGAVVPHGMAKPGPDTSGLFGTVSFQHYSGYFAEDNKIRGFSQLHLHGTGATDYGILSLMPTLAFDASKHKVTDYETLFEKADERVAAGYYGVKLANGIDVELTATKRVALHRYTMPAAGAVVVDLTKVLDGGMVDSPQINVTADEVAGSFHHKGGMSGGFGGYTVYFAMRATTPFIATSQWAEGAALALPAGATTIAIGLSFVSLDGARRNLATEVPTVDFDLVKTAAHDVWRDKLNVVKVTGGTEAQRRTFYTSFYHAFMMPTIIDDADGQFVIAGKPIAQHDTSWQLMSDMSLWDTYRTTAPLYSWLAKDSARDQVESLAQFGRDLGFLPKWAIAIGESGTMLGASGEVVIADAVARGAIENYPADIHDVLVASRAGGRDKMDVYTQYGFVPNGTSSRPVSMTLEYAHDDFALAQLTKDPALLERSHGWRTLYDPAVGFLRGKNTDGTFPTTAFDPTIWTDDYAEADAWQSLFAAGIHDPLGLVEVLGGQDAALAKLTELFDKAKTDWENSDESANNFPRRYYWAGNEPDINTPFLFAQIGRPELTQKWARWAMDTFFTDQPDGVPGNDDGGAMGAWYVLSALGLYPVAGSDLWIIGTPIFAKARIMVGSHELAIEAKGSGIYVASVKLDGASVTMPQLTQAQLDTASTLTFEMSEAPTKWGWAGIGAAD
jgi:predicted alpha-1,2-mannosidase